MKNGRCTEIYPREFLKETQTGRDGYPLYRRRSPEDGGFSTVINIRHSEVVLITDGLSRTALCSQEYLCPYHVEYCNSIKSIKYVSKYINKGSDMAVFDVTSSDGIARNEVNQYEMGVSSWKTDRIFFTEGNAAELARFAPQTTLTAFFRLCNEDEFARTLFYHQVQGITLGIVKKQEVESRKVGQSLSDYPGIKSTDAIDRVYTVHPKNSECFHLRLLLHEVPGPTSFQYLKTFEGRICSNYKEACQVRGLLEYDEHWNATLEEAAFKHSPRMLRDLFTVMLQVCAVSNPNQLWINHQENISEDILHQVRIQQRNMDMEFSTEILNEALIIQDKVRSLSLGGSDLKSVGLPQPNRDSSTIDDVIRERTYNVSELRRFLEEMKAKCYQIKEKYFRR
ncbi:ATP-dependent DNA helicase [Trichonephila clavata]|uniref:ATP-dependent DNA helicase n=1 Tax=Trichonephila clavata TaxID=2740835 RepID=A0A8X6L7V4_TRICU|nr:ATP-dependent DNA helicase [Trichonephila clavata]